MPSGRRRTILECGDLLLGRRAARARPFDAGLGPLLLTCGRGELTIGVRQLAFRVSEIQFRCRCLLASLGEAPCPRRIGSFGRRVSPRFARFGRLHLRHESGQAGEAGSSPLAGEDSAPDICRDVRVKRSQVQRLSNALQRRR